MIKDTWILCKETRIYYLVRIAERKIFLETERKKVYGYKMINDIQKKEILLCSFEELKDDVIDNCDTLAATVSMMLAIDEVVAVSMWIYLLDRIKNFVTDDLGSALCDYVILDVASVIGIPKLNTIIVHNEIIKNSIFKLSKHVLDSANRIITECIIICDLIKANEFLELYTQNKNYESNNNPLADILLKAVKILTRNYKWESHSNALRTRIQGINLKPFKTNIDDEIDFILEWSKRVKNISDAVEIQEAIQALEKQWKSESTDSIPSAYQLKLF